MNFIRVTLALLCMALCGIGFASAPTRIAHAYCSDVTFDMDCAALHTDRYAPPTEWARSLVAQIDPARLMSHVQALAGFQTRYINSTQDDPRRGIGAARQYIHDAFTAASVQPQSRLSVWDHTFTIHWEDTTTLQHNVVASLKGTDGSAGVIIVGAHYDAIAYDTDSTLCAPGADDNGTGIAALLEIARIMSQTPHRATILFIAFSAEEEGRVGSTHFVNEYLKQYNVDVRAVFTLDTIGNIHSTDNTVNDSEIRLFSDDDNNSTSRQLSRVIQLVASTYAPSLQVAVQPAAHRPGRWGDHMSFTAQGYAAVRFVEAAQAPLRQNNSHDSLEWINPAYLTHATEVTLATLAVFANGLQAPDDLTLRANADDPNDRILAWTPVAGASGYVIALRQPGAITYDQVVNVGPDHALTWHSFTPDRFAALSIATIDAAGRWGPFSAEFRLDRAS